MGIKLDAKTGLWTVSYSKRPEGLNQMPVSLRRIKVKNEREAKRVYTELVIEVQRKLDATIIPTWQKLVEEFLNELSNRGLSARTIENYDLCLKAHTFSDWGGLLIDKITPQDIRHLIQNRVGTKSVSHQQSIVKFIRNAFQFGLECGYIKSNPVPQFRFKIVEKAKRVLTEGQVGVLLTKAKQLYSEWYPHWALAAYTGMRSGELYALTWDKVIFDSNKIIVDQAWNSKDGFKSTKSGHDRIVPINETLMHILKELKLEGEGGKYVLPRRSKWDSGDQAQELQKFLILIGLPPVRFHDLRATWATILLGKGVEPVRVMKMGGWRDMKTMMIYMRMAGLDTQGATDCLTLHDPVKRPADILKLPSFGSSL